MNTPISTALSRRKLLAGLGAAASLSLLRPKAGGAAEHPKGPVTALVFDSGGLVLAADGFWTSADGGATFAPAAGRAASAVTAMATHPARPGVIYAAHAAGRLTRSDDGGRTWHDAGAALPQARTDAVAIAAHDPDMIYVAVRGDGLWTSKDAGASWEFAMDRPFTDGVEHDVLALASVSSPSGMGGFWIFAGTGIGVTKVPDCFCRWQEIGKDGAMDALVAGQAPTPKAGTRLPREPVTGLALAPSVPNVLFAGLPSGIWKSADTGESWQLLSGALASPILAVDPRDPHHIVGAASDGTILSSRDGGLTWAAPVAA
jgi:photosystem II stability/assembly factor-like uncharacterized protein